MGVTITAKNPLFEFDTGYITFFYLRKNIAQAIDEDFGNAYLPSEENLKEALSIINQKHLDDDYKDVLDFLYSSDCEGKIGYKTCKKISELLEKNLPYLKDKRIRYAQLSTGHDYEDFILFLKDCVKYHKNMRWS